jgi:transposase-like protein
MEPKIQRWTAKRKVELVLQLIKGEKKLVQICRENDLKQSEVEGWLDTFMKSGEHGLKTNSKDEQSAHQRELKELRATVGELYLELEARKKMQALIEQEENGS